MSHGAAAFTIIGFAVAALLSVRLGTKRYVVSAIALAIFLYAPWIAYQKFYDPPGDRLIKWQLAGVHDHTDKRSALTTLEDVYGKMTWSTWKSAVTQKAKNAVSDPFGAYQFSKPLKDRRSSAFFLPLPAMGTASVFAIVAYLLSFLSLEAIPLAVALLVNYVVWIILEFHPADVVVHQSSYFMLIAPLILIGVVLRRWPWSVGVIAVVQIVGAISMF